MRKRLLALLLVIVLACPTLTLAACPKRYEDYRCITARDTLNYKLAARSKTAPNGLQWVGDKSKYYLVAIGKGWGYRVGDKLIITLKNGKRFRAVYGDEKSHYDTYAPSHLYVKEPDGRKSYLEFIVDTPDLPRMARVMGDINYIQGFNSSLKSIKKIGVVKERRQE